jgi:hypothetical protein
MNAHFPDYRQNIGTPHDSVFEELRRRLGQEVPCRRLADLLESVNAMQRARAMPEEYDLRFEEFVYRAENYMAAVRPFFPALVVFLSSREVASGIEPRNVEASAQAGIGARVA